MRTGDVINWQGHNRFGSDQISGLVHIKERIDRFGRPCRAQIAQTAKESAGATLAALDQGRMQIVP